MLRACHATDRGEGSPNWPLRFWQILIVFPLDIRDFIVWPRPVLGVFVCSSIVRGYECPRFQVQYARP